MSRSYKKPYEKVGGYGKLGKRLANKRVRRSNVDTPGSTYKKVSDSWDIVDCRIYGKNPEDKRK